MILAGDWMSLTIFINENGSFRENKDAFGSETSGWWNCIATGDFDGDGDTDISFFRPSNGYWHIRDDDSYTPIAITKWGVDTDIPVPGDYDGDGAADIAILRPSNGKWFIQGVGNFSWYAAGDYPLPVRDTNADGDVYQ